MSPEQHDLPLLAPSMALALQASFAVRRVFQTWGIKASAKRAASPC
jgi:hypothetical protein